MKRYGVILAGGGGTRFWPLSRKDLPKQFLNLTGTDLLLNETIDRLSKVIAPEDIYVVTSEEQTGLVEELSGGRIAKDHILSEPAARNTAACIGYAAEYLSARFGDGVMCILPSDHYIRNREEYVKVLEKAVALAENTDNLVTVGIRPTFAATGYGYLKMGAEALLEGTGSEDICFRHVEEFVEKPDSNTAKRYLEAGTFCWNSGMFAWKCSVIRKHFARLLPDLYEPLQEIAAAIGTTEEKKKLAQIYPTLPKISIDYGIMERVREVVALPGDFGWSDVGSWDALQALFEADENGNVLYGDQIHIGTRNCIAYAKTKLIAALGVEDLIIVEADDAILVCRRDMAQEVGKVVEQLKTKGKTEYL